MIEKMCPNINKRALYIKRALRAYYAKDSKNRRGEQQQAYPKTHVHKNDQNVVTQDV